MFADAPSFAAALNPAPPNRLTNDPTPTDQAIYVPALSPGYCIDVYAKHFPRPLPQGVQPEDLNFLDPINKLFRISHALISAGRAVDQQAPCIATERDRKATQLICDSGGYQIAQGLISVTSDRDRVRILRWMERYGDVGMTLDVPTGPVLRGGYQYATTADCLTATLAHLQCFQKYRQSNLILLNVLQGNDVAESDTWYHAVRPYRFEGWAFAGVLRRDISLLCRRILMMCDDGEFDHVRWIHVLGTCDLQTAVLLTALQRSINKHINAKVRISYDTSTPFRNLRFKKVYTLPTFETKRISMGSRDLPDDPRFVGSQYRWPWPSPLGDLMTLGDFCVPKPASSSYYRDVQSGHYLAHHNLAALCWAIATANRIFDSEAVNKNPVVGKPIAAAVLAIDEVLRKSTMMAWAKQQSVFSRLDHDTDASDDERDIP